MIAQPSRPPRGSPPPIVGAGICLARNSQRETTQHPPQWTPSNGLGSRGERDGSPKGIFGDRSPLIQSHLLHDTAYFAYTLGNMWERSGGVLSVVAHLVTRSFPIHHTSFVFPSICSLYSPGTHIIAHLVSRSISKHNHSFVCSAASVRSCRMQERYWPALISAVSHQQIRLIDRRSRFEVARLVLLSQRVPLEATSLLRATALALMRRYCRTPKEGCRVLAQKASKDWWRAGRSFLEREPSSWSEHSYCLVL